MIARRWATFLFDCLSDRPSQDYRKPSVEIGPRVFRERIALPAPCDRMRKPADTDREFERLFQAAPPRLEVGVAQPAEPGVIGTKSVELLEEPERLEQREKGMRDRRVSPIDDAEPTFVCIEVCHVEVVVLDRLLDSELSQHGAEFGEARRVIPQAVDVIYREWELARGQTLITRRQGSHAQIRHAVGDVI